MNISRTLVSASRPPRPRSTLGAAENPVSLTHPISNEFNRPRAIIWFTGLKQLPVNRAASLDHKTPFVIDTPMIHALTNARRGAHHAFYLAALLMSQSPRHE